MPQNLPGNLAFERLCECLPPGSWKLGMAHSLKQREVQIHKPRGNQSPAEVFA